MTFYSSLITLISVCLFMRQVAVGADELDLDFAALAGLFLGNRPVIDDVFLSQILRDLRESFEEFELLRRQEDLPAGLFAQTAQLFIIGVFDQTGTRAFEVLGADAEDGDIVTLRHLY